MIDVTCIESLVVIGIIIVMVLIVVAFGAGYFFGKREGYIQGKADGIKQSNKKIFSFLTRSIQ